MATGTGTFAGWTVANVRATSDNNNTRNFFIDTPGTTTPTINGISFNTAQNTQAGGGGSFYAVTMSDYPGRNRAFTRVHYPDAAYRAGIARHIHL